MPNYQKPTSEIRNTTKMSLSPLLNIVLEILVNAITQENYITDIRIKKEEINIIPRWYDCIENRIEFSGKLRELIEKFSEVHIPKSTELYVPPTNGKSI